MNETWPGPHQRPGHSLSRDGALRQTILRLSAISSERKFPAGPLGRAGWPKKPCECLGPASPSPWSQGGRGLTSDGHWGYSIRVNAWDPARGDLETATTRSYASRVGRAFVSWANLPVFPWTLSLSKGDQSQFLGRTVSFLFPPPPHGAWGGGVRGGEADARNRFPRTSPSLPSLSPLRRGEGGDERMVAPKHSE